MTLHAVWIVAFEPRPTKKGTTYGRKTNLGSTKAIRMRIQVELLKRAIANTPVENWFTADCHISEVGRQQEVTFGMSRLVGLGLARVEFCAGIAAYNSAQRRFVRELHGHPPTMFIVDIVDAISFQACDDDLPVLVPEGQRMSLASKRAAVKVSEEMGLNYLQKPACIFQNGSLHSETTCNDILAKWQLEHEGDFQQSVPCIAIQTFPFLAKLIVYGRWSAIGLKLIEAPVLVRSGLVQREAFPGIRHKRKATDDRDESPDDCQISCEPADVFRFDCRTIEMLLDQVYEWAPNILRVASSEEARQEEEMKVEAMLSWFTTFVEAMSPLAGLTQQSVGRYGFRYTAAALISVLIGSQMLASDEKLKAALCQCLRILFAPAVADQFIEELLTSHNTHLPHASTISKFRLIADAALMLLFREANQKMTREGAVRYLRIDSSPKDYDWLMLRYDTIMNKDLLGASRAAKHLIRTAEQLCQCGDEEERQRMYNDMKDDRLAWTITLQSAIRSHNAPPVSIGPKRKNLTYTLGTMLYSFFLENGSEGEVNKFTDTFANASTDLAEKGKFESPNVMLGQAFPYLRAVQEECEDRPISQQI
jgi:hypothetical protein